MNQKVLRQISYGLFVVGASSEGKPNGQLANTVFQVTSEPPRIAACIGKKNLTHSLISGSGGFSVSILSKQTPMEFMARFGFKSGRDIDKLAGVDHRAGATGSPIVLDHALGYLDVRVEQSIDLGTHSLFIGLVVDAEMLSADEPMTYAYYHRVKGGAHGPLLAPQNMTMPEDETADRYRCEVCNYIYDPAIGDPEARISPGTAFVDLPGDWLCPVCGAPKTDFVKEL